MNDLVQNAISSHGNPRYTNLPQADLQNTPLTSLGAFLAARCDGGVVLVQHKRVPQYNKMQGLWAVPGGRVDADESIAAAALREFSEETGLSARLDGLLAAHHFPGRERIFMWFIGIVVGGVPRVDADPEALIEQVHIFKKGALLSKQMWSKVDRVILAHMGIGDAPIDRLLAEAELRDAHAAQQGAAADADKPRR